MTISNTEPLDVEKDIPSQRLEDAIRHHALSEWSEHDIEGMVQYALDLDDEERTDPEHVAHVLWTMGARGPKHKKCRVDIESSYANQCDPCQSFLLGLAFQIIRTSSDAGAS